MVAIKQFTVGKYLWATYLSSMNIDYVLLSEVTKKIVSS